MELFQNCLESHTSLLYLNALERCSNLIELPHAQWNSLGSDVQCHKWFEVCPKIKSNRELNHQIVLTKVDMFYISILYVYRLRNLSSVLRNVYTYLPSYIINLQFSFTQDSISNFCRHVVVQLQETSEWLLIFGKIKCFHSRKRLIVVHTLILYKLLANIF